MAVARWRAVSLCVGLPRWPIRSVPLRWLGAYGTQPSTLRWDLDLRTRVVGLIPKDGRMTTMKRKMHTPEQALRNVRAMLGRRVAALLPRVRTPAGSGGFPSLLPPPLQPRRLAVVPHL